MENSIDNTVKGIESCALLCGKIDEECVRVTHLIFPKQTGTACTVEMVDDASVDACVIGKGLSTLGWIHTYPTQTAFLSSIDMHTQFCYQ